MLDPPCSITPLPRGSEMFLHPDLRSCIRQKQNHLPYAAVLSLPWALVRCSLRLVAPRLPFGGTHARWGYGVYLPSTGCADALVLVEHSPAVAAFKQLLGWTLQCCCWLLELFARTEGHFPGHHAGSSPTTAAGCNISRPIPAQTLKCCSVK